MMTFVTITCMRQDVIPSDLLFETIDVFGRKIRTTKSYRKKIKEVKHQELRFDSDEVKEVLVNPDDVRKSVTDATVFLFSKKMKKYAIPVVAVKTLNGEGFIITAYQTSHYKQKGELLWPKLDKK